MLSSFCDLDRDIIMLLSCYHHVTILALHHSLPTRDGMHVLQKPTGMHAPFTRDGLGCTLLSHGLGWDARPFTRAGLACTLFITTDQPSATSPLFFDNLHFEHFDKSVTWIRG
jgi:hypothetical protein